MNKQLLSCQLDRDHVPRERRSHRHLARLRRGELVYEEALATEHGSPQSGHDATLYAGFDRDSAGHADHRTADGLNLLAGIQSDRTERVRRPILDLELHEGLPCRGYLGQDTLDPL